MRTASGELLMLTDYDSDYCVVFVVAFSPFLITRSVVEILAQELAPAWHDGRPALHVNIICSTHV